MIVPSSLENRIPSIFQMARRPAAADAAVTRGPVEQFTPTAQTPPPAAPSRLDQAREVALLPAFDPAVGSVMVMAGLALGMGGAAPVGAAMQPALTGRLGDQMADIRYALSENGMTSLGSLRPRGREGEPTGNNVSERLAVASDDSCRLTGRLGDDAEDLMITANDHGLHVVGKVGETAVDLTYGLPAAGFVAGGGADGQYPWASVDGHIGGLRYQATATLVPPTASGDVAAIEVRGNLDTSRITKSYKVSADADARNLTIDGHGDLGGVPQQLRLVVDMDQANAGSTGMLASLLGAAR